MLLEVQHVTAGYGKAPILHDVNLFVETGEIVSIIGPNGAGKSTVLRTIAGQLTPTSGQVRYESTNLIGVSIAERGRRGLVFIPQGVNIFPSLTVRENLEIAGLLLDDKRTVNRAIREIFERYPPIGRKCSQFARNLSGGERQLLALSRIRLLRPRLVLLDEPSLGLAPLLVDHIFDEIRALPGIGASILLIEQNARKALSVSHRAYVLELGRNRLTGSGEELLADPQVQRLYLGG